MGGKKKTAIARPWRLGGIPVDTIRLEPFEERIFEDSFSNLRMAAVLTKEDFPHFAPSNSEMNQRERAARASIGYFFQYFEGRYQRAVIADALPRRCRGRWQSIAHNQPAICSARRCGSWIMRNAKTLEIRF